VSELKSNKGTFTPKSFIADYIPKKLQDPFLDFLQGHDVSLNQFSVDISEIKPQLKQRALRTHTGVRVTVPPDESDVVDVQANAIIIADAVVAVG
jgi:hypothetical protein